MADCVEKLRNRGAPKISQMSHVGDFSRCKACVESIRAPAVVFAAIDVVPHVAASETHQRASEFSVISEK
jgi:hypothetical protein